MQVQNADAVEMDPIGPGILLELVGAVWLQTDVDAIGFSARKIDRSTATGSTAS